MGDTELESVTSTMSTSKRSVIHQPNCGSRHDAAERLHQWLHQIEGWDKRDLAWLIVESAVEAFGDDGVERLMNLIRQRLHTSGFNK